MYTPEDILAEKTGCKILNKGVGGYSSDQAYLKFLNDIKYEKIYQNDLIILSHVT